MKKFPACKELKVCQQIIGRKYQALFALKMRKDDTNLSSAAVIIGPLTLPADKLCKQFGFRSGLTLYQD